MLLSRGGPEGGDPPEAGGRCFLPRRLLAHKGADADCCLNLPPGCPDVVRHQTECRLRPYGKNSGRCCQGTAPISLAAILTICCGRKWCRHGSCRPAAPETSGWHTSSISEVEKLGMPNNKIKDLPPRLDPKRTPVRPHDKEAPPEPEHVDPPPRDVREAPAPNPDDKNS
jgi:hypothetical protein